MSALPSRAACNFLNLENVVTDSTTAGVVKKRKPRFNTKTYITSWNAWQIRLALWGGALAVGLAATLFAKAADQANDVFQRILEHGSWLPFILTPAGLMLLLVCVVGTQSFAVTEIIFGFCNSSLFTAS